MEHFDLVVVGAGSSGGVLAARASEDATRTVLLLEAGPDFPDEAELPPLFAVSGEHSWQPGGVPEFDWHYWHDDLPNGHRIRLPRGKLVGGSSMVNSTIAVRGAPFDYDRWAGFGNTGWAWQDLLPYFTRIESDAEFGEQPYHGRSGPIHIRRYRPQTWTPVNHAFMEGCLQLGWQEAPDLNAPEAHSGVVGPWPHNRVNEVRLGTLVTYLRAARRRPNLTIRAQSMVDTVLFEGHRATGVSYIDVDRQPVSVRADLVVLSAGVYGTPMIVQRSGIGPADHLRRLGIDLRADLPAGRHLLDHPACSLIFHAPALAEPSGRLLATNCRGPLGPAGQPEWQAHPMPIDEQAGTAGIFIFLTRQDAEGEILIRGDDPFAPPRIDHRYATRASDLWRFRQGWSFCRELIATPAFAKHDVRELRPDLAVEDVLATGVVTAQHQAGTCRMGPASDRSSVVDHELRVLGFTNLMVADASIFPDNIMNNTNLTCYVIGEVAADKIRSSSI